MSSRNRTSMITDPSTAGELRGREVRDSSGDKIGEVEGLYVDTKGAMLRYLVVSTGWFGTKRHIVPMDDVSFDRSEDAIVLPYGRDQLKKAPTYEDAAELGRGDEQQIYDYYDLPGYWEYVRAKQTTPAPTPEIAEADVAEKLARGEDPLRPDVPGAGMGYDDIDESYAEPAGPSRVRWYDDW